MAKTAKPAFDRLAPFIQDYIYRHRWIEMRAIQVAACEVIFDTEHHLLLASGTASGKTEAAFLPAITKVWETPSTAVGILYISPLKALINDQFIRLNELCEAGHIRVTKWHGDVGSQTKNRLLERPEGILQITPESLEAMLMRRPGEVIRLFADLRFIVIDEVHHFMNNERGMHLLCLLERIRRLTGGEPRRIGLSATLGDYEDAKRWLRAGTSRECVVPAVESGASRPRVRLYLDQVVIPAEDGDGINSTGHQLMEYYRRLFQLTKDKRCIVFSGTKSEVEGNAAHLKRIAQQARVPDVYHVHHGSLSKVLREDTEKLLKQTSGPAVTCASVTLELGIDIGTMERIVQTGPIHSVSSFVQRLGRSGRRNGTPEMAFLFREFQKKQYLDVVDEIHWGFIRTIAIIQLYLEERWIEPAEPRRKPFSLLYHQTISCLYARAGLTPAQLAQTVLTLPPFRQITADEYKVFLRHLRTIGHLEQGEGGELLLGNAAERLANHYDFFSVFEGTKEYVVRFGAQELGTITTVYPEGYRFALAGHSWEVVQVDEENQIIYVEKATGLAENSWKSLPIFSLHQNLAEKMREVLATETAYPYLSEAAHNRLNEFREMARRARIVGGELVAAGAGGQPSRNGRGGDARNQADMPKRAGAGKLVNALSRGDALNWGDARKLVEAGTPVEGTQMTAGANQLARANVIPLSDQRIGVFPWIGTKALTGLSHVLESMGLENGVRENIMIEIVDGGSVEAVRQVLAEVGRRQAGAEGPQIESGGQRAEIEPQRAVAEGQRFEIGGPQVGPGTGVGGSQPELGEGWPDLQISPDLAKRVVRGKYSEFVPEELLVVEYREDWLDLTAIQPT